MVFFSSPEETMKDVSAYIKADLSSFIWVDWDEIESYVEKSDAILIGPGFMRYHDEKDKAKSQLECDEACKLTKTTTETLLSKFPKKKWVIDAGSLQTMDPSFIPKNSIITPNKKEFEILFGDMSPEVASKKYKCVIVLKGPVSYVYFNDEVIEIEGGNPGLTKGGTGDVQAGLTASFLTKNDPILSASAASFIVKATADDLYKTVGVSYNADDLADAIPLSIGKLL